MKILIKNGQIVNFDKVLKADLLIQNNKISEISKNITVKADKEIDAKGKHIFPGFIDLHVHLRTPGREDEEDLYSGSLAAVKGGFTTVFCMPNTNPAIDNEGLAKWIVDQAQHIGLIDIYPVGAITKNREGKELTEFLALEKAGCFSVSDDGNPVSDTLMMRRALEYAKMSKLLVISHCEDKSLSNGAMRESFISSKYGISSVASISESLIVAREIELTRYLNSKIHLAHISTAKSVEIIKRAKEEGISVTAETCPHYFVLNIDDIKERNFDSNLKVNPPLGDKKDIKAIKDALQEGVIDCIATDHAPHSQAEKELPFENAPFGVIGLETAFALANTYLVGEGVMDVKGLAEKLSYNPACISGLSGRGELKENYLADLVIADINKIWQVDVNSFFSKSKNTPFSGYKLKGTVEYTIHKGKIVYTSHADN